MKIFVFGNPDLEIDALPILILDDLRAKFPQIDFQFKDPNEEWEEVKDLIAIDFHEKISRCSDPKYEMEKIAKAFHKAYEMLYGREL